MKMVMTRGDLGSSTEDAQAEAAAQTEETKPAEVVQGIYEPRRDTLHSQDIVAEFHGAFGHPLHTVPHVPSAEMRVLRLRLIAEELGELAVASGCSLEMVVHPASEKPVIFVRDISGHYPPNVVEAADALGDLDYVVAGSFLAWGFPGYNILMEVHASNMSKLGADDKPIYDQFKKVLKGPNYFKPNIAAVLKEAGWTGGAS